MTAFKKAFENRKQVDGEVLASVLTNSISEAFNETIKQMEASRVMVTMDEYIRRQQIELKGLLCEDSITIAATTEYYEEVEKQMKKGNTITKIVYDSLNDGQRFHFNKHYNIAGNKVLN